MAIKILVTQTGAQVIAETKIIENTDTGEKVAYWISEPRVLSYERAEEGSRIGFAPFCAASDEAEFGLSESFVVAVLEPRAEIAEHWKSQVYAKTVATVIKAGDPLPSNIDID